MDCDLGRRRGGDAAHGVQYLDLFIAEQVGLEIGGRFHGNDGQQLEQVILEHVPEHAGLVVVARPPGDRLRLEDCDLDVVDVVSGPDGLKDSVGEPEHKQVLDGFLTQIVVDAEHLVLGENRVDQLIEFLGRRQVGAEGFFDNHPPPTIRFAGHARRPQVQDRRSVERRRQCQVIQAVGGLAGRFDAPKGIFQSPQVAGGRNVAAAIVDAGCELRPFLPVRA